MQNPLGQTISYPQRYAPEVLFGIERQSYRSGLIQSYGYDLWRCYEFSWILSGLPPRVGILEIVIPAFSPKIVESKSLKLYLGSFAQSVFQTDEEVLTTVENDLQRLLSCDEVKVHLFRPQDWSRCVCAEAEGICIDSQHVSCDEFEVNQNLLKRAENVDGTFIEERLYSHLLRSLCPVTGQPDWATVEIWYKGSAIDREALLRYVVSYRLHQGFHEHCCEMILSHLKEQLDPESLTVRCLFTRRGGIDIAPFRSLNEVEVRGVVWKRLFRQ